MRPIARQPQLVTQGFKPGIHSGVDLRCVSDTTGENLPVVTPENCEILRQGMDGFGNHFLVVKPLETSDYKELKFIHIAKTDFEIGQVIDKMDFISFCIIGGNSAALHLHFETWQDEAVNPLEYFDLLGIEYKIKGV